MSTHIELKDVMKVKLRMGGEKSEGMFRTVITIVHKDVCTSGLNTTEITLFSKEEKIFEIKE